MALSLGTGKPVSFTTDSDCVVACLHIYAGTPLVLQRWQRMGLGPAGSMVCTSFNAVHAFLWVPSGGSPECYACGLLPCVCGLLPVHRGSFCVVCCPLNCTPPFGVQYYAMAACQVVSSWQWTCQVFGHAIHCNRPETLRNTAATERLGCLLNRTVWHTGRAQAYQEYGVSY